MYYTRTILVSLAGIDVTVPVPVSSVLEEDIALGLELLAAVKAVKEAEEWTTCIHVTTKERNSI